jgi:hypothetical protein
MKLNDSMLFRWMGYGIERPNDANKLAPKKKPLTLRSRLSDDQREQYLDILRDAIDPNRGLMVSDYSEVDQVGEDGPFLAPRPCLFFTEQAATSSDDHWRLYGRLGMGFSKRAIFKNGGCPVIYTSGRNDPVEKAVSAMRRHFMSVDTSNHKAIEALELIARLIKSTHLPPNSKGSKRCNSINHEGVARRSHARKIANPMAFPQEKSIPFLAEREWRLLPPAKMMGAWNRDSNQQTWYRPKLGTELQLVVLPDNETLAYAIDCSIIRKNLISENRPPVQLITAEVLFKV